MLKSSNQFKGRIQFGEHLLQNGKINEALKIFDDVLDKEPEHHVESDYIFNLLFAKKENLRKDDFLKCLDTI